MWYSMLCSEKTKFCSYDWCILGMVGAILIPPIVLLLSDASIGNTEAEIIAMILEMLYLGQVGVVVIGAAYFGQEYLNSALRTSLLAVPSRWRLLCAKTIVLVIAVIFTGIVSSMLCMVVLFFQNNLELTVSLMRNYAIYVLSATCSWIQLAWISASLSIIIKTVTVPVALMMSLILGLSQMLFAVLNLRILIYTPILATMKLFLIPDDNTFLGRGIGLLIQFLWALILAIVSAVLFARRDVR